MQSRPREIQLYQEANGACPYADWYGAIKDKKTQAVIDYRISRVEAGTLGDCKPLGDGVYELRIHHGPGWRVYFAQVGNTIVLLLCGSDKASQQPAIRKAKAFWKDYQQRMEAYSR